MHQHGRKHWVVKDLQKAGLDMTEKLLHRYCGSRVFCKCPAASLLLRLSPFYNPPSDFFHSGIFFFSFHFFDQFDFVPFLHIIFFIPFTHSHNTCTACLLQRWILTLLYIYLLNSYSIFCRFFPFWTYITYASIYQSPIIPILIPSFYDILI